MDTVQLLAEPQTALEHIAADQAAAAQWRALQTGLAGRGYGPLFTVDNLLVLVPDVTVFNAAVAPHAGRLVLGVRPGPTPGQCTGIGCGRFGGAGLARFFRAATAARRQRRADRARSRAGLALPAPRGT